MPDAPWMSLMLGQLLDVIESDPALQARVRRLLAPPPAVVPVASATERPEVEWIGELTPTDFGVGPPDARRAMSVPRPTADPPAPRSPAVALPVVVPPPGVRKVKPGITATTPRPRPPAASAPAETKVVRSAPPAARPKPVAIPTALRAPSPTPPPPPPAPLLDPPTRIAPFRLDWLASAASEPEPSTGAPWHPLVDGLRRVLGTAPSRLVGRLPADLLRPAGIRPPRPAVTDIPPAVSPEERPRPTPASLPQPAQLVPQAPPTERQRAAALLAGRTAVMIGGECRPDKQEALRRELGLRDLRWISTRAHTSIEPLLTAISDPDVGLVLLLIKLASHSFGDLAEPCKRRGIPLVRIPGGYGANQLAHQILEQAGERLGAGSV